MSATATHLIPLLEVDLILRARQPKSFRKSPLAHTSPHPHIFSCCTTTSALEGAAHTENGLGPRPGSGLQVGGTWMLRLRVLLAQLSLMTDRETGLRQEETAQPLMCCQTWRKPTSVSSPWVPSGGEADSSSYKTFCSFAVRWLCCFASLGTGTGVLCTAPVHAQRWLRGSQDRFAKC